VREYRAAPVVEVVLDAERPAGQPRVFVDPQLLADLGLPPAVGLRLRDTSPLRTISSEPSGKMLRTEAWTLTVPGPDSSTVSPGPRPSTESVRSGPPDRNVRPDRTARHHAS
jgi:hypothetical protein